MQPHLLYVEDDESLSFVTRDNLELQGYRITYCPDGGSAMKKIKEESFDLCILDVMLPDVDGFAIAQEIRKTNIEVPIIFLTARSLKEDKIQGLKIGADDYITKPFSPLELIARIQAILRRNSINKQKDKDIITAGDLCVDMTSHEVTLKNKSVQVGPTEFRLLTLLLENKNRIFSRESLLSQVWSRSSYVEERTVDVHILRLRKALTIGGYDKYIETVRGIGYRFSFSEF